MHTFMEHKYVYCAASSTGFCLYDHLHNYRFAPTVTVFRKILFYAESMKMTENTETYFPFPVAL
jgi:hypothetical protein